MAQRQCASGGSKLRADASRANAVSARATASADRCGPGRTASACSNSPSPTPSCREAVAKAAILSRGDAPTSGAATPGIATSAREQRTSPVSSNVGRSPGGKYACTHSCNQPRSSARRSSSAALRRSTCGVVPIASGGALPSPVPVQPTAGVIAPKVGCRAAVVARGEHSGGAYVSGTDGGAGAVRGVGCRAAARPKPPACPRPIPLPSPPPLAPGATVDGVAALDGPRAVLPSVLLTVGLSSRLLPVSGRRREELQPDVGANCTP